MSIATKWLPLALLISLSLACNAIEYLPALASATPTSTPTPTQTPTPTPSPTPTPTPTPPPEKRVTLGERAIFNGDWETALAEFEAAQASSPEDEIRRVARLGIGRARYLAGQYEQAEATLSGLIAEAGDSPLAAEAFFFLGETYRAMEQPLQAAEAYLNYLALRPGVIDYYIYERRGDALFEAGDYAGAVVEYQAALQSPRLEQGLELEIRLARAYALSGDYATALVGYQDIYNRTSNDYTRAQMDFLMGQVYAQLGQPEQAQAAYLDAVMNFPRSLDSYNALVALVEAGVPVDELQRGLVDYFAGQYAVAIAAFDRYLQGSPADPGAALYYRGLAFSALGGHAEAIESWERLIRQHPQDAYWDEAWDQKAYVQWNALGDYPAAVKTLTDFVEEAPNHPRAAEFLFEAASVAERGDRLDRAARLWERTASDYPASEQAFRALFLAGITRYRLADYAAARALFQRILDQSSSLEERSAAFLWRGKAQLAQGDAEGARASWEQGAALDPTGYYSERARDLLAGLSPFTPPQEYDLAFDLQAEGAEAEAWMRTVFSLPTETDLSGLGPLREDPRFRRGEELWRLGLYEEARAEFEDLRLSLASDPAGSYRLARYLVELGLYRSAILAARQVLTLAGMDDAETMTAPVFFNHIRFGPYFRDLIIPAAQAYNFHPLFLFSVARQESLFEGFVSSPAGARGLMQIVPPTGQEIAANLGWPPDYTAEDLYRPIVSVRLGCEYLNRQRGLLGGDLYAALAAYNGGPGNAIAWQKRVPPDADLFLEAIRFEETRNYIKRIYEIFSIYRRLYDRTP